MFKIVLTTYNQVQNPNQSIGLIYKNYSYYIMIYISHNVYESINKYNILTTILRDT